MRAPGFAREKWLRAESWSELRTEDYRFHVSASVRAGFVPVVPCVFSIPFDRNRPISDSLLHILAGNDELFEEVFDGSAETEFKSSPGIHILVNFKWRQYARREYMAQFFTYLVHYLCFGIFAYGLVNERSYLEGPPCNVFSEKSVNGEWNMTAIGCVDASPAFASLLNTSAEDGDDGTTFGNTVFFLVMAALTLFFSIYHLCMMIVRTRSQGCAFFWSSSINKNYLDVAAYSMMAITVIVFLTRSVHAGAVGSVTSVVAGWKFMMSWRGFSGTSHYVRTIIEITRFSYIFLFIMIFFSLSCGWAFMLLFGNWQFLDRLGVDEYGAWDTVWRTVVSSFDFMIGSTDTSTWADSYYELIAIPLYFFFSFMVVLVMLNLVIALMADGYSGVMETKAKAKLMERASIIVGIEQTLPKSAFQDTNRFPVWVHALLEENKGSTPIGDMPASFEDKIQEALAEMQEKQDSQAERLQEALAAIEKLTSSSSSSKAAGEREE